MSSLKRATQQLGQYVVAQNNMGVKALNAFITLPSPSSSLTATRSNGPLSHHYIAIKDNISTAAYPTTCASPGLIHYMPLYNATVVARLLAAGASLAGKTNLDEFGMGSHSLHSHFKPVQTESGCSAGGSSGGSAVAVATGQCSVALGTDTGGSVRLPAAYNGVVGFKPSYGRVSRWGVVAYANSLDTVGFLGKSVGEVREVFAVCEGEDERDPTCLGIETRRRIERAVERCKARVAAGKLKIGVPSEYNIAELHPQWRDAWTRTLRRLQDQGHSIHTARLPHTRHALSAYYVLAPAEASSNLAKYDGVRYGAPPSHTPAPATGPEPSLLEDAGPGNNLFTAVRGRLFGPEVQRRILLGAYTLSADAINNYFIRAQRIRRLVVEDFDRIFAQRNPLHDTPSPHPRSPDAGCATEEHVDGTSDHGVDVLITPTTPGPAPLLREIEAKIASDPLMQYTSDVFTVPASLAGLPAVSVPAVEGVGIQILGQFGDDERVLEVAERIEGLR